VELHDVDDELVRPGHGAGQARAGFRDAREPADGGAIPEGFGAYALLFACAYSGLQIGRNAFVVAVTPRGAFNQKFRQILAWSVLSAPLWVAGGVVDADAWRWVLWLGALGLDLAGPLMTYWLPGAGTTPMSQWQIEGAHFGERFQLVVIIALGESVVLAGATASDTGLSVDVVAALLLAFLSSTALWWLYFGQLAGTVLERIRAASAGERARSVATSTPTSIFRSSLGSCSSRSATSS
jgi:low temperature requirement protein LtrA